MRNQRSDQGIVIYGPPACGKTTHAAALACHYGKTRIVDDWQPGGPLSSDTLALTNIPHQRAVHFLDAARAAGIHLTPARVKALVAERSGA